MPDDTSILKDQNGRPLVAIEPALPARRKAFRWVLLIAGPLLVVLVAGYLWLIGGRYVSTDNAYVQADTVTLSTDVAGIVTEVAVHNNELVKAGQLLFRLDDEPYRITLAKAKAQLGIVRNDIESMRANYREKLGDLEQAKTDVAFYEREFERSKDLLNRRVIPQAQFDQAKRNLDVARQKTEALHQQAAAILANLGGELDLPSEQHPRYLQAVAEVDSAQRNLRHTAVTAPMDGMVTNVENLQPGEYLPAAVAAFSLVATGSIWVEANPKETDITYLTPGQAATVTVDAFPDREWQGRVASVSPATGAQFALLPPQNASGNWVKVVQRVPVRIAVQAAPDAPPLRAGMSAVVTIDTGRQRSLPDLIPTALGGTPHRK